MAIYPSVPSQGTHVCSWFKAFTLNFQQPSTQERVRVSVCNVGAWAGSSSQSDLHFKLCPRGNHICFSLPECLWGWIILYGEGRTNIDINIMLQYLASETLGNWKICALELGKNPPCLLENKEFPFLPILSP